MLMPTESNGGVRSGATQDRATQASMRLFPPVMSLKMPCNNNTPMTWKRAWEEGHVCMW